MSACKKKLFSIIYFIDSSNDNKTKSIDCVPSSWIFGNIETQQSMTKFMPPPYTKKKCNALHKLIQARKSAPDEWPNYPIKVLQSIGTYAEALIEIDKLKHKDYIYTTDQTDIENNTSITKEITKKSTSPIRDMSGNLLTHRKSSSSESSFDNEAQESSSSDESINQKIRRSQSSFKQQTNDISSQGKFAIASQQRTKLTSTKSKLKPPCGTATSSDITLKYLKSILSCTQGLKHDQEILKNDLRLLKEQFDYFLMNKIDTNETVSTHWTKTNNIHWPLKTKEDYDNLNKLLQNENIRIDFISTIGFIIDIRTTLSKNLLFVIRKFLHKDLATKFTCVKQVKNKFTMKPSLFYDCILEAVFKKKNDIRETFSEKVLEKLIGVVLTNSKDWGIKGRLEKTIKDAVTEEKEIEEDKENVDNQ